MFSTGQFIFGIIFFVAFVIIMIYSYRGDKMLHKKYYKGNIWVLIIFILFIGVLIVLKSFLKE